LRGAHSHYEKCEQNQACNTQPPHSPGFPFCLPGHEPVYSQSPPLGRFFVLSTLSKSGGARRGQPCLFRVRENQKLTHFQAISPTSLRPLAPSPGLVALRRRALSGWHRQSLNPPHHASKQVPRQMALRQQQPVIASVLDQPPAGLHQPLLQAAQRPLLDPAGQHHAPPAASAGSNPFPLWMALLYHGAAHGRNRKRPYGFVSSSGTALRPVRPFFSSLLNCFLRAGIYLYNRTA